MKAGKGPGKTVRGIVAVFQSQIHDPGVSYGKLLRGKSQPATPDILSEGHSAKHMKDLLKIKGRYICLCGQYLGIQILRQVCFQIGHGLGKAFRPSVHKGSPFRSFFCCKKSIAKTPFRRPTYSAQ